MSARSVANVVRALAGSLTLSGFLLSTQAAEAALPKVCKGAPQVQCTVDTDCTVPTRPCIQPIGLDTLLSNVCMSDVYTFFNPNNALTCTAEDIKIASVTGINITDDGCAFPGDTVTFNFTAQILLTAQGRHDIGVYFATDGDPNADGALTGACSISTLPYSPDLPYRDLDHTLDDTGNAGGFGYCTSGGMLVLEPAPVSQPRPCKANLDCAGLVVPAATCEDWGPTFLRPQQDTCGDIDATHNPIYVHVTGITATCVDPDRNGQLDIPYCVSWRQPGANDLCLSPRAAFPGSPAKCKCDDTFDIPITVPGQIKVDKVTDPAGHSQSFHFEITGPVNQGFNLTDADSPFQSTDLVAGTYQITETEPPRWDFISASCTRDNGTPLVLTDDVTFPYMNGSNLNVISGEIITCTFNNELVNGPPETCEIEVVGGTDCDGVELIGTAFDPENDPLTFHWTSTGPGLCSSATFFPSADVYNPTVTFGSSCNVGSCTLTLTVTDGIDPDDPGCTASTDITVDDETPPLISALPGPTTIECPAVPSFATPTATDACDLAPSLTFVDVTTPGTCDQEYSVTRTWTATDVCGNTATASQTITVADTTAPAITTPAADKTVECDGAGNAADLAAWLASNGGAAATDLCGSVTWSNDYSALSDLCGATGSATVTFTATDECGNKSTTTATFTIEDNTAPLITPLPGPSKVICPAEPVFATPTASDVCDSSVTLTYSDVYVPSALAPEYVVTRTWTATDDCGNVSTRSQTITRDCLPTINVVKVAIPTQVSVSWTTGADVTFSVTVTNTSVSTDTVTINSLLDSIYKNITTIGHDGITATTCSVPQVLAPNAAYNCTFTVHKNPGTAGSETDVVTACGKDDEQNPVCDDDDATVMFVPKGIATDTSRCIFDRETGIPGRQFRLLLSQDVDQYPHYRVNATNPGQFFFNLFSTGTPGSTVNFTVTLPYPFVTQGAQPLHVYGGLSTLTSGTDTCLVPGVETEAQPFIVKLSDYGDPGNSCNGYTLGVAKTKDFTFTATVPASGFMFIAIHLDYGLKGKDPDLNPNTPTPVFSPLNGDAVLPGTTQVCIPQLGDHVFSYTGGGFGNSDTIENYNSFKKNPGVGGRVTNGVAGEGIPGVTIQLWKGNTKVGTGISDADGWYQIIYKHTGKPAAFKVKRVTPQGCQAVTLNANKFAEVNWYGTEPPTCP